MKKYGYVIEMRKTSDNYPGFYSVSWTRYAGPLKTAVVERRALARVLRHLDETVRKVELFKNGKPKKIVK